MDAIDAQKVVEGLSAQILSWTLSLFISTGIKRKSIISDVKILGEELFTLPNIFSLSRVVFGLILWLMIRFDLSVCLIATIFFTAIFTDWLDGAWSRLEGNNTKLGAILDPWCDKFLFVCCATGLYHAINPFLFWIMVGMETLLSLFSILAMFGIKRGRVRPNINFKANLFGKTKFCLEGIALFLFLFKQITPANYFLIGAIIFAVGSATGKIRELTKTP